MSDREIILSEEGKTLVISERKGNVVTALMRITAGAVSAAQLKYYEANLKGKIKQTEADLILKYFYGWNMED